MSTTTSIEKICAELNKFLQIKNQKYGDSALDPIRIFSGKKNVPDNVGAISDRIDDKLSRIKNSEEFRKNDIVDLTGYLVLLCTAFDWTNFEDLID